MSRRVFSAALKIASNKGPKGLGIVRAAIARVDENGVNAQIKTDVERAKREADEMASIRHKVEEARIIREGNYIEANLRKQALGEIRRKFGSGQGSFPEDIGTSRRDLHTSSAVYDEGNKNPRHASLDPKDLFDQIDKGNVESVMAIMSNPDIDHYVNKVDKHGRNALHYAVLSRDPKMVEAVLNCKDFIIGGFRDHSGNTALHYAASFGNHAIVEILVNKEFDINDENYEDKTPADLFERRAINNVDHGVVVVENEEIASLLGIKPKEVVKKPQEPGRTNYEIIAKGGAGIERGSSGRGSSGGESADQSSFSGQRRDMSSSAGEYKLVQTPLHKACLAGDKQAVAKILADKGSRDEMLNVAGKWGNTPLHIAVERGDRAIVDMLLEAGADDSRPNLDEYTPVMVAKDKNMAEFLHNKLKEIRGRSLGSVHDVATGRSLEVTDRDNSTSSVHDPFEGVKHLKTPSSEPEKTGGSNLSGVGRGEGLSK